MTTGIGVNIDANHGRQRVGKLKLVICRIRISASQAYNTGTGVTVAPSDFDLKEIVDLVPVGCAADEGATSVGYSVQWWNQNGVNRIRLFKSAGSAAGHTELTTDTGAEIINLRAHVYGIGGSG